MITNVPMVRSAAKNHKFVAIVTNPEQYPRIIQEMKQSGGAVSDATRSELARKAYALTAAYDSAISAYLADQAGETNRQSIDDTEAKSHGEQPDEVPVTP